MKFQAEIKVMPHKELLDPQGKAVHHGLDKMGLVGVENVRIGKCIHLTIESSDTAAAEAMAKEACEKLLVNKIMERYSFTISAIES